MTTKTMERDDTEWARELSVSFRHEGTNCILALHGSLQTESVMVLEAQFDLLGSTACHRVVLDLSGLHTIDGTGVRVLTGLRHYVEGRGGHLTVAGASPWVAAALAGDVGRDDPDR